MSGASFSGMQPWEPDSEIIMCTATLMGDVDLHNYSDLLGYRIGTEEARTFTLEARSTTTRTRFELEFVGIEDLRIEEHQVVDKDDENVIYGVDYFDSGSDADRSSFLISAGPFEASFRASHVRFVVVTD